VHFGGGIQKVQQVEYVRRMEGEKQLNDKMTCGGGKCRAARMDVLPR
jgi:hypothetical protein